MSWLARRLRLPILTLIILVSLFSRSHIVINSTETEITIYGYVTDADGKPVENSFVMISGVHWTPFLLEVQTDHDGYYNVGIPSYDAYYLYVDCSPSDIKGGFGVWNYKPITRCVLRDERIHIQENFTLEQAGTIIIKAFDSYGSLIRNHKTFHNMSDGFIVTTYLNGTPSNSFFHGRHISGFGDLSISAFAISLNSNHAIILPWEVQGFGKIVLKADNDGEGYSANNQGESIIINLNYELAKTKFRTLNQTYYSCVRQNYSLSSSVEPLIETAEFYLNSARRTSSDIERAYYSDRVLNYSLWVGEKIELEKALQDIEKYRKQNVTVQILDVQGNPFVNSTVMFNQTSHDFLFGFQDMTPSYMGTASILKDAGFNLAVVCARALYF